jgi:formylglycine-generating enzyme required for sulfatase activity
VATVSSSLASKPAVTVFAGLASKPVTTVFAGLAPKHMGKITQAQWEEFVKQKTESEVLAISNKFAEILKKNIYPHHLGSSGYVGNVGEWKKKLEENVSVDKPNLLEGVEERTQHWLLARSNLTEDGTFVYKKKEAAAVQQKTL